MSKRKYKISHIEENMLEYGIILESPVVIDGKLTHLNTGSNAKVDDKTVHNICKLLESKKYTMPQICNKLKVSFNIVSDIKRRRTHTKISKLYNF